MQTAKLKIYIGHVHDYDTVMDQNFPVEVWGGGGQQLSLVKTYAKRKKIFGRHCDNYTEAVSAIAINK